MAAEKVTTWAIVLKDLMTAPLKTATSWVDKAAVSASNMGKIGAKSQEEWSLALKNATEDLKFEQQQIKELNKSIRDTEKAINSGKLSWGNYMAKKSDLQEFEQELKGYNERIEVSENSIREASEALEAFKVQNEKISTLSSQWIFLSSTVNQFAEALDFSKEYDRLKTGVEHFTDLHGSELTKATRQVYRLAKVHEVSGDDIAKSANALAKNYGISFEQALDKIDEGFTKGANLSGDMLSVLSQYGPLMQEMGYSLDETVAKVAHLNKAGIDAGTAFGRLTRGMAEMNKGLTEKQEESLKKIGLLPEDIKGKTVQQAMEAIGAAMDESDASLQERSQLMSDLFGRNGEKMGSQLVKALFEETSNLDELPAITGAGEQIRGFMADVQSRVADTVGSFAVNLKELAPVFTGIGSGVTLMKNLSSATWVQTGLTQGLTAASKALNFVMSMNPLGAVVVGLAAVSAGVIYMSDKFEWAAGIVGGFKNSFKDFGQVLLDVVLLPIRSIINGMGAMSKAIAALMNGDWKGAKDAAFSAFDFDPIVDIYQGAKEGVRKYKEGSDSAKSELRAKNESKKANSGAPEVNPPGLLDFVSPDEDKGTDTSGGKGKGGLSVSGAGGSKSITMNLEIKNYFTHVKGDVRQIANQVAGQINDRLRDALVAI